MKLHWGHGIGIFYALFVIALVYQVIKSTGYDNSLVSEAYYKDDLNYQQHYVKLKNTLLIKEDFKVINEKGTGYVEVRFPSYQKDIRGTITLFNPVSSAKDVKVVIKTDVENVQRISTESLAEGLWKLKVDWVSGSKPYFSETSITI